MKTIKLMSFVIIYLFDAGQVSAQSVNFITSGQIAFEKSINTHALIRSELNQKDIAVVSQEQYNSYKRDQPQFKKAESNLFFSGDKMLYQPIIGDQRLNVLSDHPAMQQNNIVFTDLSLRTMVSQKQVLNETFLLKDSIRKISWKITSEMREIAGYTCRRANAMIMDSIYVVAFYTDMIIPEGGPESFNGLPGMILGIALPHQNITWFATRIVNDSTNNNIKPPTKGKLLNFEKLKASLESKKDRTRRFKNLYLL